MGFEHVDKNGDGEVDEHELSKAMRGGPGKKLAKLKTKMPSAAEIIETCDKNGNALLNKKEVVDCIMKEFEVPKEYRQHVVDEIEKAWPSLDADGSGEVDVHELEAAMGGKGLAQKGPKGGRGPSPADIIAACDADESATLSLEEAHACIDAHVPEEMRE